jgi:hypothetical protein
MGGDLEWVEFAGNQPYWRLLVKRGFLQPCFERENLGQRAAYHAMKAACGLACRRYRQPKRMP